MNFLSFFLFTIGLIVFGFYRYQAKSNVILRRNKSVNLQKTKVDDDIWVTGVVHAPKPVLSPHFNYESVYYEYEHFHRRDSRAPWVSVSLEKKSTVFWLDDGTGKIKIDPDLAMKKFLLSDVYEFENEKYVLTFIPASGVLSCAGVVAEGKSSLIAKGEVPLLITPLGRRQFFLSSEKHEIPTKVFGTTFMWSGLIVLLFRLLQQHLNGINLYIVVIGMSVFPFLSLYYYYSYNRLSNMRRAVFNSWASVESQLHLRREWAVSMLEIMHKKWPQEHSKFSLILECVEKLKIEKRLVGRVQMENKMSELVTNLRESIVLVDPHFEFISSENLNHLSRIENKVSQANHHYASLVSEYNSIVQSYPDSLIADRHYFEVAPFYGDAGCREKDLNSVQSRRLKRDDRIQQDSRFKVDSHNEISTDKKRIA